MIPKQGRVTPEQLRASPGRGNSLTCFAQHALDDWSRNIPKAGTVSRERRRIAIFTLANGSFIKPIQLLNIVRCMKRQKRM